MGFQCPSCVAEGAKSTRSGRTAYGGKRSTNPQATTIGLIGLNVAVWIAILVTGGRGSRLVDLLAIRPHGFCQIGNGGFDTGRAVCTAENGAYMPGIADGAYWQLLTSAFTHVEVIHIGFNMVALYLFGPQIEMALGRLRYLALYLVSGLAGSVLVYWAAPEFQSTVGASGAIFGLLGGFLILTLKIGGNVRSILVLLGLNAVITFSIPNISWQGHLGGFLGGVAVSAMLVYAPKGPRRSVVQGASIGALVAVLAVAVAVRTVVLN